MERCLFCGKEFEKYDNNVKMFSDKDCTKEIPVCPDCAKKEAENNGYCLKCGNDMITCDECGKETCIECGFEGWEDTGYGYFCPDCK
jgi:hypothetical protein